MFTMIAIQVVKTKFELILFFYFWKYLLNKFLSINFFSLAFFKERCLIVNIFLSCKHIPFLFLFLENCFV